MFLQCILFENHEESHEKYRGRKLFACFGADTLNCGHRMNKTANKNKKEPGTTDPINFGPVGGNPASIFFSILPHLNEIRRRETDWYVIRAFRAGRGFKHVNAISLSQRTLKSISYISLSCKIIH